MDGSLTLLLPTTCVGPRYIHAYIYNRGSSLLHPRVVVAYGSVPLLGDRACIAAAACPAGSDQRSGVRRCVWLLLFLYRCVRACGLCAWTSPPFFPAVPMPYACVRAGSRFLVCTEYGVRRTPIEYTISHAECIFTTGTEPKEEVG